ncbi:hypothetical protein D6850_16160 [Roseovarius spongiae]|uniref:Uncharacterized protein n=1 Tax=Roseovarius spongiae TaxID=2320272 RepID=A0A3A8ATV3_9RHOB|nr:hypothetical protein [Roseovarius spongiae]RKF13034.1 hypothetical protein D6850_16160 [Roseovarius spongiae]
MELIADILLVAGALGAGLYCYVLGRRLRRFNDLENGVGGAVAVLSVQVDDLTRTLDAAQGAAGTSTESLEKLTDRAEGVARRLELMVAAMHDLPDAQEVAPEAEQPEARFARHDPSASATPESPPLGPVFRRHETGAA